MDTQEMNFEDKMRMEGRQMYDPREETDLYNEKALAPDSLEDEGQYGEGMTIKATRPGEYDHVGDEDMSPDRNGDDDPRNNQHH